MGLGKLESALNIVLVIDGEGLITHAYGWQGELCWS